MTKSLDDLEHFTGLKQLVIHILKSVEIKKVTVYLPSGFDIKLIDDPLVILPVNYIEVSNVTYNYVFYRAEKVLNNVKRQIEKLNDSIELSFDDKVEEYREIKRIVTQSYQYYDSMNPIRYMSNYHWQIRFMDVIDGKQDYVTIQYPNSKINLSNEHWNIVEKTFLIIRHLHYEILCLVDDEIQKLNDQLDRNNYSWEGKDTYEIYELIVALIASDRIKIAGGGEYTFVHDFLSFFGLSDSQYLKAKGKVLNRKKRSIFMTDLEKALEKYGKTLKDS